MSSALSSVRTRRTNPQTAAPVQRNGQQPTTVGTRNVPAPTYNPSPSYTNAQSSTVGSPTVGGTPTAGLSLHQIIDIYGKRILQLESLYKRSVDSSSSSSSTSISEISLQDVQVLIDSKIDMYQQKRDKKDKEAAQNQPAFQEEIIQEFHSRFELLANEIADLKDIILQLQRYTMTVNKILVENAGLLKNNEVMEETFTLGNLPEISEDNVEYTTGEEVDLELYEEEIDPTNDSTVGDYFK